jgi:hypothetical protein
MAGGNSTPLAAAWVGSAPGCALVPEWYHWSIPSPSDSGSLNTSSGPAVNFTGDASTPGRSVVEVRGAAALRCGPSAQLLVSAGFANMTVTSPLELGNLSVAPAPVAPGQAIELISTIQGGDPPYTADLEWGDGSSSQIGALEAGSLSASHVYLVAGTFDPRIVATDSSGLTASLTDPAPLEVEAGTAAAVTTDATSVDVNAPVRWNATILDPPFLYDTIAECDGAPSLPPWPINPTAGSCTFPDPGPATITFGVGMFLLYGSVQATATVDVVAAPSVSVDPTGSESEVGAPTGLLAEVNGGVPPLTLECAGPDLGGGVRLGLLADGPVEIPIVPSEVGRLQYAVEVADADGLVSPPAVATLLVEPALNGSFVTGRTLSATGVNLSLDGSINSGVPPFVWVVLPDLTATASAPASGEPEGVGSFTWWGDYQLEGEVGLALLAADGAGGLLVRSWSLPAVPVLNLSGVSASPEVTDPGAAELWASIAGGLPPFNLTVRTTEGLGWNFSVVTDGTSEWSLSFPRAGRIGLSVLARDAAGASAEQNATVTVPSGAAPPTAAGYSAAAAGLLAAGLVVAFLIAGAAVYWLRRRGPAVESPPKDPVGVLRTIIAPADGAERGTVELLAEEEGVPLATARATLDRLIAEGVVRSETDADGTEVLAWDHEPRG